MFVIIVTYTQPIEVIDNLLVAHRTFLEAGYQKNYFIASGPQNPRTGGVILWQLSDRAQLETIMNEDPFSVHGVASYQFIEFTPVKFHKDFAKFISSTAK